MSCLTPNKRLISLPELLPTNRTISTGKSCMAGHKQVKLEQDYCTTCSHLSEGVVGNLGTSASLSPLPTRVIHKPYYTTIIYFYFYKYMIVVVGPVDMWITRVLVWFLLFFIAL